MDLELVCKPDCLNDDDCNNDYWCDGIEFCEEYVCIRGTPPCQGESLCNDEEERCVITPDCIIDDDCDNGTWCDGAETCREEVCFVGDLPCLGEERCSEENHECVPYRPDAGLDPILDGGEGFDGGRFPPELDGGPIHNPPESCPNCSTTSPTSLGLWGLLAFSLYFRRKR
jgi:uncharacterized protein (TIGR03382 family)